MLVRTSSRNVYFRPIFSLGDIWRVCPLNKLKTNFPLNGFGEIPNNPLKISLANSEPPPLDATLLVR